MNGGLGRLHQSYTLRIERRKKKIKEINNNPSTLEYAKGDDITHTQHNTTHTTHT
jgi:hypothetical protein